MDAYAAKDSLGTPRAPGETITARVRCASRVNIEGDQDTVHLVADYFSDEGVAINVEWAKYTPALLIRMNVRRSVPFEPGASYELTFRKV